ncbi:hypothetical protein RIF29_22476 [Crotalaria pallida]|uniref:Uncharacterized protein n=1 Tax=Crotalaria pallida TaxID=3830 RepID=A0AAN9IEH5_CROPI
MYSPKKHHNDSIYPEINRHYPPPEIAIGQPINVGPWSTGLCDFCDDYNSCCLTLWCPCVTFGRIAEIVDEGVVSCRLSGTLFTLLIAVFGFACCYTSWYRSKLRTRYLLEEECNDCMVHVLCEHLALCQEYRELQNRGYNMSLGWEGNVERQRRAAMVMQQPEMQGEMKR